MVISIFPMFLFSLILSWALAASSREKVLSTGTRSSPVENLGKASLENCIDVDGKKEWLEVMAFQC